MKHRYFININFNVDSQSKFLWATFETDETCDLKSLADEIISDNGFNLNEVSNINVTAFNRI